MNDPDNVAEDGEDVNCPLTFLVCDQFSFGKLKAGSLPLWAEVLKALNNSEPLPDKPATPMVILSVTDGLLIRRFNNGTNECQCISPREASTTHLKKFLSIYFSHLARWRSRRVSFQQYFQISESDLVFDECELTER